MRSISYVIFLVLTVYLLTFCTQRSLPTNDLSAYYTNTGAKDSITGKYADIVVNICDDMKFVFSRDSAYLPFLETKDAKYYVNEFFEKKSNSISELEDEFKKYSYVRIIENTKEEILVHWRYIPDMRNIDFRSVVHEYFIFTPDRKLCRIIRSGNMDLEIYNNPKSRIVQELNITPEGIKEISLKEADLNPVQARAIEGSPLQSEPSVLPLAWWKFDEGLHPGDNYTSESVDNIDCPVYGNIALWKDGISGSALAFDGYYSKVVLEKGKKDLFNDDFTLEAWLALGAYPWDWGSLIDYSADDRSGLYVGVNSDGKAGIRLSSAEGSIELVSEDKLPLYKWTHVAVNYNQAGSLLGVYINGKKSGELKSSVKEFSFVDTDLSIGLNKLPMGTADHVSRDYPPHVRTPLGNHPGVYGIEGLIDELKIYDRAIDERQIAELFEMTEPAEDIRDKPDLEPRILPGKVDGQNAEKFGASYTSLKFHELWDNMWRSSDYPDVHVKFDELPVSIVYWKGINYGPSYVTENNHWMSDQSSETGTEYGCAEHMADKQNRYSHVRIIENTPARVVVHWRYASADITYAFSAKKAWTDEYHYIYPDGSLLRYVHWYTGEEGFQDLQFLTAPGEKQEDVLELQALTIANTEGDIQKMDWSDGIPRSEVDHATIALINFKSEYDVFAVFPKETRGISAWGVRERATPDTYFAGPWNHWPVGQMPNDGNYAMHTDRVSSSAIGGSNPRKMAMYGFSNERIQTLIPVDKSWNYAPGVSNVKGAENMIYEREQKAYSCRALASEISFEINASEDKPLHNPCFEIDNWNTKQKAALEINGEKISEDLSFRQGVSLNEEGKEKLLIWLKLIADSKTVFKISR